jgi:RNA methyltransferase, TrmH family
MMRERVITSPGNEKLKLVRKLASRRWREKLGLFVAEGEDLVEAAAASGVEPVELLVAGETVAPELLAELSSLAHPPRVVAVYRRADLPRGQRARTLALWRVADPGNIGTLVRAADAFEASLALSPGCADPTAPKALRASAGAIFRVPVGRFEDVTGRRIALVARDGTPLPELELHGETVFVLGAERAGLPADVVAACEARATIPQATSAESLNVAMAGTIALYELSRRA